MKTILALTVAALLVIGLVSGVTWSLFSDTETAASNQFTAGVIDLQVDCAGDTVFAATDDPLPVIFNYLPANDIKPGDSGVVTLSLDLTADSSNADLWILVNNLNEFGGLNPEPEQEAEGGVPVDDIASRIDVSLWLDADNDQVEDGGETNLFTGTLAGLVASGQLTVQLNAATGTTYYVGWSWVFDSSAGNEYQGDYCTFDVVLGADQL